MFVCLNMCKGEREKESYNSRGNEKPKCVHQRENLLILNAAAIIHLLNGIFNIFSSSLLRI